MELIVGTNSYMTVVEADELIHSELPKNNVERQFWDSLEDIKDKEALIISGTRKIDKDSMHYDGYKFLVEQDMQFPRINDFGKIIECPDRIKIGLLRNILKDTIINDSEEKQMIEKGITSYKVHNASVTFDANASVNKSTKKISGVYPDIYVDYFIDYINLAI